MSKQRIIALIGIIACALAIAGVVWANGQKPTRTPPSTPAAINVLNCQEENGPGMTAGSWVQQTSIKDPRTGGTVICVTNYSGTESRLFAQEVIAGKVLQSRVLWNSNPTLVEGSPTVDIGPNGFLYLYIPVRVYYNGGDFLMTQGIPLAEELPTAPDTLCQKDGRVWDESAHGCQPKPTDNEIGEKVAESVGKKKIPGVDGFRPGTHFWVSPTEQFSELHEYVVGADGSLWDSTGMISPAYNLAQRREINGPDGTPWFSANVIKANGETWLWWNVVPGHAGWIEKK